MCMFNSNQTKTNILNGYLSSTDEEGDIIVARLNADNLDTVKITRTNKKASFFLRS